MDAAEALADVHGRTQECLVRILGHAATLGREAADRALPGFHYPTVGLPGSPFPRADFPIA